MQFAAKDDFLFIGKTSDPGASTLRTRDLEPRDVCEGERPGVPRGDGLCWHCCHACDDGTLALPMPIDHDERTDVFTVVGTFCSFGCMKAFNSTRVSARKDVNYLNISLLARRFYGRCTRIRAAPPRNRLEAFGGSMTIDEFREASRDPPYPAAPFSARGEPAVAVAEDDSHNVKIVPHENDPVVHKETRSSRQEPSERAIAPKKPAAKRKKKEQPAPQPASDDAILKLRRTDDGGAPPPAGGGQRCILESMLSFAEG